MSERHHGSIPVSAVDHIGIVHKLPWDAARLVIVYVVLLYAVPSNVTISSMGALGRPHFLWGLAMFAFWAVSRLQWRSVDVVSTWQPVRVAFVVFFVIALVSFAEAMLRGQPGDQVSQLITSMLRLLSWAGVLLVIIDGVRTMRDVSRIIRVVAIGAALLALLALLQSFTGQSYVDFWGSIPGLATGDGGIAERAGRIRPAATATHPLEFGTILNAALPLCVAGALSQGFGRGRARSSVAWWWGASALLTVVALMSVSRSSIIGLAVAVVLIVPAMPRRTRLLVVLGGFAVIAVMVALTPGLVGTTLSLFTSTDGSTLSRTGALERLPGFVSASPLIGIGFGTFLPRYYVFDNGWAGLAIELGILGVVAFAGLIGAAVWSAWQARRRSESPLVGLTGHAVAASVITAAVVLAFFDGLAFPMSGGFLFVMMGLCAAIRSVSMVETRAVGVAIASDAFEESTEVRRQSRRVARSLPAKRAAS
ncbi:O-antigen ligase family protein [Microbacterium sp. HJ5]